MELNEIGDPSLTSTLNGRYNGSLSQHQGTVYDANIQQSASPVSQVYTASGCKGDSGYWHPTSEYNVNPVSNLSFFFYIHSFVSNSIYLSLTPK